ncbi:type II toxin-antitoxin system VapC family toxin [Candidatus Parcubacteria bacterium]|nr:type II toxin-antitoxin system VapC family toxin [Candidatus Parcubacteria bacterium]
MNTAVIDASFCLTFLLTDEQHEAVTQAFHAYASGKIVFIAPTILPYEIANGLLLAARRKRIPPEELFVKLEEFTQLQIPLLEISAQETLAVAHAAQLSFYDAAYATLAWKKQATLLTLDSKLARAFGKIDLASLDNPLSA